MSETIDAHQHYWNPARGDYDWMPMDNKILARVYGPQHLNQHLEAQGIDRTILVQAAATVHETEYMLGIADATANIAGVVGWIDFERPDSLSHLQRLSKHPKFLGVRPMIQDIPDDNWMHRGDVQWAYQALVDNDLTFDALGFPRHLENFHSLLTRYPDMRVVIDHCMKPQIRNHSDETFSHWAAGMTRLAEDTGAFCKISGLVTESDGWKLEAMRPYVDHVVSAFGPDRIMWGSDWPVCRLEAEYDAWLNAAKTLIGHLSREEQDMIFGGTAARFYRV